jgi:cell division septum initiation protein DivIVA
METTDDLMQVIREHRSSESNFNQLYQTLQQATKMAEEKNDAALAAALKEVDEKYAAAYKKAQETGGTAWPEFEKFVTQFERTLTANNGTEKGD